MHYFIQAPASERVRYLAPFIDLSFLFLFLIIFSFLAASRGPPFFMLYVLVLFFFFFCYSACSACKEVSPPLSGRMYTWYARNSSNLYISRAGSSFFFPVSSRFDASGAQEERKNSFAAALASSSLGRTFSPWLIALLYPFSVSRCHRNSKTCWGRMGCGGATKKRSRCGTRTS